MAFTDSAQPSRAARIVRLFLLSVRAQWFFFAIPVLYLFTNSILMADLPDHGGAPVFLVLLDLLSFAVPVGVIVMLVLRLMQFVFVIKPESPVKALGADIAALVMRPKLLVNALPVFAAMVFFNKAMIELKPAIPAIHPFSWDTRFMEWDRMLHFGTDPWVILQPLLGHDTITFAINMAYNFWFVALFAAWFWFGFQKQASELRTQFFLSYMLAWWIGGGLLAVYFSSAGPVYYDELGLTPNPYLGLFAYLNDADTRIPLWFLDTQQMLWDGYTGKGPPLGISAMPSMHNASAVLFALAFAQVSKRLGWFFAAYAAVILVGSVHLGWHYAIDGYAGIAIALVSWWLAGRMARWLHQLPALKRYNESLAAL
jgi:membrane-associated phospholipid phosphatase